MKKIFAYLLLLFSLAAQAQPKKVSFKCPLQGDMNTCINNNSIAAPLEVTELLNQLKSAQLFTGDVNRFIPCSTITSFQAAIDNEGDNCTLFPDATFFTKLGNKDWEAMGHFLHAISHLKDDKKSEDATAKETAEWLKYFKSKYQNEETQIAKQKAAEDLYQKKKSGFGDLFNKPGQGSGNSSKPNNAGNPNGNPNSSTASNNVGGSIGSGIGNRKVISRGKTTLDYNENGTIVVKVCVNSDGSVDPSSVKVSTKGTTSSSIRLKKIATEHAKTYRFERGDDNECGTITYNFRVK